jgi:phospholipid/cholesterol/gamma-HCH transport system substrate-binding protein
MTDERRLDLRVGVFVLIAASTLAIGLFAMGTGRQLFGERYVLVAKFHDLAGLTIGAPVRLAGVTVGTVTRVTFPQDLEERLIAVELAVDRAVQSRIREDSVASIQTVGLLGDKYVELTIGTPARPTLAPGAEIATVPPPNLYAWMQRGEALLDDASRAVQSLNLLLVALGQSELFDQLAQTLRSVNGLAQRIDRGEGLLKALLEDRQGGQLLSDVSQAAQALSRIARQAEKERLIQKASRSLAAVADITREVRQGDGLAHAMLYGSEGKAAVASLTHTLRSLEETMRAVNAGDGLLHALLYQGQSPPLLQELATTIGELNAILTKLEKGEGTLGALLNDPSVYDQVQAILDGTNRSWLLRWAVRHALKTHEPRQAER